MYTLIQINIYKSQTHTTMLYIIRVGSVYQSCLMMLDVWFPVILTLRYQYELELYINHTYSVIFLGLAFVSHASLQTDDRQCTTNMAWIELTFCVVMIYYTSEVYAKIKIHICNKYNVFNVVWGFIKCVCSKNVHIQVHNDEHIQSLFELSFVIISWTY